MASRRERARRAGLLLLGLVVGLGVTVLGLLTYVNHVRHARTEALVSARLGLPREAFSLERITVDGHVVGSLSRVALLARGGDTVATAPEVTFSFDARSLAGKGPIEFDAMEVRRPFIRLAQAPDGTWNFSRIWRVQAGGKDVKLAAANNAADSRPYVVRNARIVDGRASVAMLAGPAPDSGTALFAAQGGAPRVRVGRQVMTVRHVTGINGTLSSIRFGGADGWKIDVGSLAAKADHPDLHVAQLAGTVGSRDGERIDFDIRTLRTDHSAFDGKGSIRLADGGLGMDFRIRAHPLDFRDLQGLGYKIPASGIARFALDVRSGARGAVTYRVTDATVAALDSRASGHATIVTSPGAAPAFSDTRLALEPLRISTLEQLGLVKPTGLAGEVRGTIASVDEVRAGRGSLRLDLEGTIAPKGGGETSTIAANGLVALGANGGAPRFDGLRIDARPLYLATLRPFAPAQAAMLRGVLRGGATLTGTTESFRIEAGNLAYQVGTAPSTRLSGLSGRVTMGTTPTFDLTARAEPLALATLTELFPALPFRTAVLNGPISIAGSTQRMRVTANLQGDAGGIDLRATVALGAVPRFDVDANLSAFRAGAVLAGGVPLDGPLSGHVAASGTTEDFRFDTNLTQGAGRLQLAGTVRRPGGTAPQVDVSGRVDNFRVGLLVGKPDLLGGPVSGPIAVSGGGRRPYRFDVGLAGAVGMLDLHGWYAAGTVPSYAVAGRVAGLDLHGLPGFATVPVTNLTATVDIAGSGTTPETFNGRIAFDASPGSTVGGVPLEAATARIVAANGVLRVDTFTVALRGARAEASGTLGLTRDDPVGLRFSLTAPNLAAVTGLFPTAVVGGTLPQVSGAISAQGTVTGSLRNLAVNATASGSNVQYGTNRAGSFSLTASGTLGAAGWTGHAAVKATGVAAAGQTLTGIDLVTDVTPARATFGLSARRDAQTDVVAAGTLERGPGTVTGVRLDTLTMHLGGSLWQLAQPARLAYTTETGLAVENLRLVTTGAINGSLYANGTLPPNGNANLRIQASGVDVGQLRRLVPGLPDVQGIVALDATLTGSTADPLLDLRGAVAGLRYGGVAADSLALVAHYAAGRMTANAAVVAGGRQIVTAEGSIPMTLTLSGTVPGYTLRMDDRLTARIVADSLPLEALSTALPDMLADGTGTARARVDVSGTPRSPTVAGSASLLGGAITAKAVGVRYRDIGVAVGFDGKTVRVDSITARTGQDGYARLAGTIRLDDASQRQVYLTVYLHAFRLIDQRRTAQLSGTGSLALGGRLPNATLSGDLTLDDGIIQIPTVGANATEDVVDVEVGSLGADTIATSANPGLAALVAGMNAQGLTVSVGDNVWLQSPDARIQIGGKLGIERFGGATRVTGDLEARRGTYTLRVGPVARDFDIVRGRVQFVGTPDLNPMLDITAAHQVRTVDASGSVLTVLVNITGTAQNPRVALSSDTRPPLPESELLSLLIFGRRSTEIANLPQDLATGVLLQETLGGFISGLEQSLSRSGFIDFVRIRTQATGTPSNNISQLGTSLFSGTTLELGKQFGDKAFVTLEFVNFFSNSPQVGIAGDYQLSRSTSIRAAFEPVRRDPLLQSFFKTPRRQASLDLHRRWEYGRPHTRAELPGPVTADTLPGRVAPQPPIAPSPVPVPGPSAPVDTPAAPLAPPPPAPAPGQKGAAPPAK